MRLEGLGDNANWAVGKCRSPRVLLVDADGQLAGTVIRDFGRGRIAVTVTTTSPLQVMVPCLRACS